MKKIKFLALLFFLLTSNTLPINAQAVNKGFASDVFKGILIEIGSDAARGIFNAMFSSNPEVRNPAFTDGTWLISIGESGNDLRYYGVNLNTRDSISLSGVTITGSSQRRVYTWRNGSYRYQVAWRPSDPSVVRLQVFAPSGKQLLNNLLYETE